MKRQFLTFLISSFVFFTCEAKILIDGIYYELNSTEKTAKVVKGDYSGNIEIPSSINFNLTTYTVNWIDYDAFSNCSSLISIKIPNSIKDINYSTFQGCI